MNGSQLRLALVLVNVILSLKAARPPNPPAKAEDQKKYKADKKTNDFMSAIIWWYSPLGLVMIYFPHFIEMYTIFLSMFPSLQLPTIPLPGVISIPHIHKTTQHVRVTPAFLVGTALVFTGSFLRLWCYRHLGKQFTFELSLRKDDKLVTTGPYSLVRHPSYLGSIFSITGMLLCQMGAGSWWKEGGIVGTKFGTVYDVVLFVLVAIFELSLVRRTEKEDTVLRKEFRTQWEAWARTTPFKLVPGVY
ncbi:unnamed protein product [Somion occarium]|uniref:Protein-S-isoprenylcysteine O-methyltransferase n=1 Tax=Somion occarium TaxID=3059160 RepID=A0ABP1D715_9APHY